MTKEKWNKSCKCNCPKEAHSLVYESSYSLKKYTCRATVNFDRGTYPCPCWWDETNMVEKFICDCGREFDYPEPFPYYEMKNKSGYKFKAYVAKINSQCEHQGGVGHDCGEKL